MKYRKDFVTNSSSSSYTCEICGSVESGWDAGLEDCGMVECEHGHTFCEDHMRTPTREEILSVLDKFKDTTPLFEDDLSEKSIEDLVKLSLELGDGNWGVSSVLCPICNLQVATDTDIIAYFLKKNGLTRRELVEVWKDEFKTHKGLKEYIGGKV